MITPKNKDSQFQFDLETVDKKRISVTCPLLNPIIIIIIFIISVIVIITITIVIIIIS